MTDPASVIRTLEALRAQVGAWRGPARPSRWCRPWAPCTRATSRWCSSRRQRCRRAVVSIFVNPAQFAPHEDFERYPRDEAGDLAKLASVGCDAVWSPDRALMYPAGFATRIVPAGAAEGLESETRPHFFGGVATVCCKLFSQVGPDVAVFGEKDYQQLCVIRQMVRDLDLPLEIVGAPTVREADGLALSSRNAYLTAEQRRIAPRLHQAITNVAAAVGDGRDRGPGHSQRALGSTARRLRTGRLRRGARCRDARARRPRHAPPAARTRRCLARQDSADRQRRHLRRRIIRLSAMRRSAWCENWELQDQQIEAGLARDDPERFLLGRDEGYRVSRKLCAAHDHRTAGNEQVLPAAVCWLR